jgi:hypothetical protein
MRKAEWEPPRLDVAPFTAFEAMAMRALQTGTATPDQQQAAMKWIVNGAGMLTSQSFVPGQTDQTAFHEGRRNVAKQIIHLTVCDLEAKKATKGA